MTAIGVLLPHFGSRASAELLRDVAVAAHGEGLTSLWVRDHLIYEPHGMEDPDPTFYETFATLGFATANAPGLDLGTAAVIPIRHPLMLVKSAATIAAYTSGTLYLGIGAGFRDSEVEAVGLHTDLRTRANDVVPATFSILRAMRDGSRVGGDWGHWTFDEVSQWPTLAPGTRLLYCGTSPLAFRLGDEHADGWAPGRINAPTLQRRLSAVTKPDADVVVIPLVALGASKEDAAAELDLPALLKYANNHRWLDAPRDAGFTTADDLEGIVLHGTARDIAAGVQRLVDAGATQVVLDLRLNFDHAPEMIAELAAELV